MLALFTIAILKDQQNASCSFLDCSSISHNFLSGEILTKENVNVSHDTVKIRESGQHPSALADTSLKKLTKPDTTINGPIKSQFIAKTPPPADTSPKKAYKTR